MPLIKQKKYRDALTDFVNKLRLSKYFRDRLMYIETAIATFRADREIFKKHFAKSLGIDMIDEKVKNVQIAISKLCAEVPSGFSRSVDKIRENL